MRFLIRGLVLAAVMAATAGCLSAEASRAPSPTRRPLPAGAVALPDYPPCQAIASPEPPCAYAAHAMVGVLHERDGCVWFTLDGSGVDARIVWPYHFAASFDPFVVYDHEGRPVARNGDHINGGGDGPSPGEPDTCGRAIVVWLMDEFEDG